MGNFHYTEENWQDCLGILGFREQPNPNGPECYDVFDADGIPRWQYSGEEQKELMYHFFHGMLYERVAARTRR